MPDKISTEPTKRLLGRLSRTKHLLRSSPLNQTSLKRAGLMNEGRTPCTLNQLSTTTLAVIAVWKYSLCNSQMSKLGVAGPLDQVALVNYVELCVPCQLQTQSNVVRPNSGHNENG